jgi:hypothetical protein
MGLFWHLIFVSALPNQREGSPKPPKSPRDH